MSTHFSYQYNLVSYAHLVHLLYNNSFLSHTKCSTSGGHSVVHKHHPHGVKINFHATEVGLLLLYAHRHRSILGVAGHIILTPANLLMEE
jgi:hypothetical protein